MYEKYSKIEPQPEAIFDYNLVGAVTGKKIKNKDMGFHLVKSTVIPYPEKVTPEEVSEFHFRCENLQGEWWWVKWVEDF